MSSVYMGIDASSTCTGWSIFQDGKLIDYGAISPKGDNWRDRLYHEGPELATVMQKYSPEKIYIEDVPKQLKGGINTLIILGGVQGFIYGVAATNNVPVEFVQPTVWRSMAGLFDGTKEGKKREVLKQKAIEMANKRFDLDLKWVSPSSKKKQDDIAESILICATMLGIISKERKFGKNKGPKSQSIFVK